MSDIRPFQAYRYPATGSKLKSLICPPYDVIGDALEKQLRRGKQNAVQVELPAGNGAAKYKNARKVWDRWKKDGVVRRDLAPAFYLYEQIFTVGGKKYSRKGFFCELKVENPASGSVLPLPESAARPSRSSISRARSCRYSPW